MTHFYIHRVVGKNHKVVLMMVMTAAAAATAADFSKRRFLEKIFEKYIFNQEIDIVKLDIFFVEDIDKTDHESRAMNHELGFQI